MMKIKHLVLLAGGLLLCAVFRPVFAGTIEAINHTKWAINKFSVNGQSGMDAIGPFQGGGGGCCYSAPSVWKSGMTVRVDWETGVSSTEGFPGFEKRTQYLEWVKKINSQKRQHSQTVPLPPYTSSEKTCGITVHFLPCDQIKVTTSCADYGSPNYPIKDPVHMEESTECLK